VLEEERDLMERKRFLWGKREGRTILIHGGRRNNWLITCWETGSGRGGKIKWKRFSAVGVQ